MISLYDSKEINFKHNGLIVLSDYTVCKVTEELNGSFELELEHPLDERQKWKQLLEGNIIKADGQLFRIYRKIKSLKGIKVNARHIYYDLLDNFLEDVRPTNLSGSAAVAWVLSHTQYVHPFTSLGDVSGSDTKYFVRKNPIEAIKEIINTWGGELVRNNFEIKLLQARGLDRGVLVSYGKNVQGIEETLDMDGLCTRLMPVGKDGLLITEKYIDSKYINNYAHPIIKVVEFTDIETETELRAAAINYILDSKCDIPKFNYKIDFLELSKTEEYKNYAVLERVYEGDTVTIKHKKLFINLKAKVIKVSKIINSDGTIRIEKIELGSFEENIATSINKSIQGVKKEVAQITSAYQTAIENATDLITGSKGGNLIIQTDENGKPYELVIMDTDDIMTAQEIWRFNEGGLAHSNTGYNGQFTVGLTKDGHIVGDLITGLKIVGEQIEGGTISGINIRQMNGDTILANFGKNDNGGDLTINDILGNLNVRIGSEGVGDGNNNGGTIILYDDSELKSRVAIGIVKEGSYGFINLEDITGISRLRLKAGPEPSIVLSDENGTFKTLISQDTFSTDYITAKLGLFSDEGIQAQTFVSAGEFMTIADEPVATKQWCLDNFVFK